MILEILRSAIASAQNADDAVLKIQSALGGNEHYIPAPPRETSRRNHQIRTAFNGRNHSEVCRRYGVSLSTLYRVVRAKDE